MKEFIDGSIILFVLLFNAIVGTIQEGDKIPADARIILSNNLTVDEAAMTGESHDQKIWFSKVYCDAR